MCLSISPEDLQTLVRRALDCSPSEQQPTIVRHRAEDFSRRRQGIMGDHFALTVIARPPSGGEISRELRFFVKTAPEDADLGDSPLDEWASREEAHFFERVYPLLARDYRGSRWCAECLLARARLLVLRDLRPEGFRPRDSGIFDEASLRCALACLARFHAASIVAEARGQPLDRLFPEAFGEKVFTERGKAGRASELAFRTVGLLADRFGLDASLLPRIVRRLRQLVEPLEGGCNVLCHGDLWRSNILFDREQQPTQCVLVDFQMLRYASPCVDLAVMLHVHASPQLRATSELSLLRHYHSALLDSVKLCGLEAIRYAPSFERLQLDFQQRRLVGMACACLRWPRFVFEHVLDDPATLRAWYFDTRIEIYERAIEQDPRYAELMRGCLLELFQEARRLFSPPSQPPSRQ